MLFYMLLEHKYYATKKMYENFLNETKLNYKEEIFIPLQLK
jgi:hypothetical protein